MRGFPRTNERRRGRRVFSHAAGVAMVGYPKLRCVASRPARLETHRTGRPDAWPRHSIPGGAFLLTAVTDLYIILARPDYALTIFCLKPLGLWGMLAKAQSPTLHLLIGYGFLSLRRWGLMLYLAYAAFGMTNASANYACFGYGRIRTVFLLSLIAFTLYIVWRRRCFVSAPMKPAL